MLIRQWYLGCPPRSSRVCAQLLLNEREPVEGRCSGQRGCKELWFLLGVLSHCPLQLSESSPGFFEVTPLASSDSGCVLTAIRQTKDALQNMSSSLTSLRDASTQLSTNLTSVRNSIENSLNSNDCASDPASKICDSLRPQLSNLGSNHNGSQVSMPQLGEPEEAKQG